MLARGEAAGVFQFESSGMREALRQVKPTVFEDLIALVALYRPGPMQYIPNYAKPQGRPGAGHLHRPAAEGDHRAPRTASPSTRSSRWRSRSRSAASRPAEADDLRKAIGKKIHALMASLKDKFIDRLHREQHLRRVARQLWDDIEKSQDYSFNKAHAACYALIAYRTAWLRANHPCEYMAALISSVMNTKDRVPVLRQRLRRAGDRGAAARRQLLADRLRGRGGEDPLRAERGQERRRVGGARDHPREEEADRSSRSGTSPSASTRRS